MEENIVIISNIIVTLVIIFLSITSYKLIKEKAKLMKKLATIKLINTYYFDVECFNKWFVNNKDTEYYANPGIFLRLDKLSMQHIISYLYVNKNPYKLSEDEINKLLFMCFSQSMFIEKKIRDD